VVTHWTHFWVYPLHQLYCQLSCLRVSWFPFFFFPVTAKHLTYLQFTILVFLLFCHCVVEREERVVYRVLLGETGGKETTGET